MRYGCLWTPASVYPLDKAIERDKAKTQLPSWLIGSQYTSHSWAILLCSAYAEESLFTTILNLHNSLTNIYILISKNVILDP